MRKSNLQIWFLLIIALIVVVIFAFLLPFIHTAVFWLACGCTFLMFGIAAFVLGAALQRNKSLESWLLGWPIIKAMYTALGFQVIAGFILMVIAGICPVRWAVLAEVIVFALSAAVLIIRDSSRNIVEQSETQIRNNTQAMKTLRIEAKDLALMLNDSEVKKNMQHLSDELRYADSVTSPQTAEIEAELSNMLSQIRKEVDTKTCLELIAHARQLLNRRNAIAKVSK